MAQMPEALHALQYARHRALDQLLANAGDRHWVAARDALVLAAEQRELEAVHDRGLGDLHGTG